MKRVPSDSYGCRAHRGGVRTATRIVPPEKRCPGWLLGLAVSLGLMGLVEPTTRAAEPPTIVPETVSVRPRDQSHAAADEPTLPVFEPAITAADVRPHIERFASPEYRGRSGRDASRAAAEIAAILEGIGLEPLFPKASFHQWIPGTKDEQQRETVLGRNLGACRRGADPVLKDEWLILGVHHDHLGIRQGETYAGADDNASGIALMLEVARQIARGPALKRSIAFVGFDLEEQMLWGSRWFVAHPPMELSQVKLFITADMVGRSLGDLPLPTVFVMGSEHSRQVRQTLQKVGRPEGLELARLGADLVGTRSDYGPFRDQKIPFLFFSTGQHPDYHSPRDVPEKIDYAKAARVSSVVLRVLQETANAETAPTWTDVVEHGLDEARALERITTLLLETPSESRPLTDVQRYMVSNVRNRSRQILLKGTMTTDDRNWLARMSQLLLLSVF